MACIDKASCGKENACDNIQIGDVVTVKETRGQGDGGVGVVRAINDDGTLRVKYTIGGGTARAVARADCRPGSHAGEHYESSEGGLDPDTPAPPSVLDFTHTYTHTQGI